MNHRRRRLSACVAMCTVLFLSAVCAHAQAVTYQLDLQAQSLADALRTLGQQTSKNIVFDPALVDGLTAPTVRAQLTLKQAIDKLLSGTGLSARELASDTVLVEMAAANTDAYRDGVPGIETVNVFGTLDKVLSIGSKSGESLRETPKSVSVVTRERIEVQNLSSLLEVLMQTTGVTAVNYSPVDSYYFSRGFQIHTVQIDGGAPAYTSGFGSFLTPDTAAYDHVEVLRGVDGIYTGAGDPGGVINLVRKRATATPLLQVNVSAGRWDLGRSEVDATGALTDDGRLRGRIVGAYEGKNYFYARAESQKTLLFGTLEYDLTPSTLLIAGASYERRKEDNYFVSGVMRYDDGRNLRLPRNTAFNPDWSRWHSTTREVFARAEHKFGGAGVVKLNLTRLEQESENRQFLAFGGVNAATNSGPRAYERGSNLVSVQDLLDLSASSTFELFGREHRYTVGADYSKVDAGGQRDISATNYQSALVGPTVDVFAFDPTQYPEPIEYVSGYYPQYGPAQNGFYGTLGLHLLEKWRLTLGARYGDYRYVQVYRRGDADGTLATAVTTRFRDNKLIPSMALSWNVGRDWTAYISYAEAFQPQSGYLQAPMPGNPLDPITGANYEVGVKGDLLGRLSAAFAVYRVERSGQAAPDPSYPIRSGVEGGACCYLPQADVTSEGFDAEISGRVAPGWQLSLGYTFGETGYTGGEAEPVYYLGYSPKHLFKAWNTWQLPGVASRWSLSAGVLAQSSTYVVGSALDAGGTLQRYRFDEGGHAIWNASLQYRYNERWLLGLFGDNLTDKTYYSVVGDVRRNNIYGTPRSYVLTLRGRW